MSLAFQAALSLVAIALGLRVARDAGRKSTRPARVRWRTFGLAVALAPGLLPIVERVGIDTAAVWWQLAIVAGLLLGGALAAIGWRGRRVGDHEHCRRCGFDLFGRPATATACAECGAPLDARRAIIVGVRARRWAVLAVGVALLIGSAAAGLPQTRAGVAWARAYDWRRHYPEAWIAWEAGSSDPTLQAAARDELFRRLDANGLGSTGVIALIDHPPPLPPPNLGCYFGVRTRGEVYRYVAEKWAAGNLSRATAEHALRAALAHELYVRPHALRGRVVRYACGSPFADVLGLDVAANDVRVTFNGRPVRDLFRASIDPAGGAETFGDGIDLRPIVDLPLGPATVGLSFDVTATLAVPGRPTLVERRRVDLGGTTEIVDDVARVACPPAKESRDLLDRPQRPPIVARTTGGKTLFIYHSGRVAIVADATLVGADGRRFPLGPVILRTFSPAATLPVDAWPDGPFELHLDPRPDLGAEMLIPPESCRERVVIPSSAFD